MSAEEILSELPRLTLAEQELVARTLQEMRKTANAAAVLKAGLHAGASEVAEDFNDELLVPVSSHNSRATPGLWKHLPDRFWMSADFDEPLEDFREYME